MSVILQSYDELKLQFTEMMRRLWLTSTTVILAISRERVLKKRKCLIYIFRLFLRFFFFCFLGAKLRRNIFHKNSLSQQFFKIITRRGMREAGSSSECLYVFPPKQTGCNVDDYTTSFIMIFRFYNFSKFQPSTFFLSTVK